MLTLTFDSERDDLVLKARSLHLHRENNLRKRFDTRGQNKEILCPQL